MVGSASLPRAIDWREKGFITDTVNQRTCGSCYAFSIAYSISGQIFKRIGRVEYMSEQQLVDCSAAFGNQGCTGGSLRNTFNYLEMSGGIMRAKDYPYTASAGRCKFHKEYAVINITTWAILPKDENSLAAALVKHGPIPVCMNAAPSTFQLYSTGEKL
jgi:cathepsin L